MEISTKELKAVMRRFHAYIDVKYANTDLDTETQGEFWQIFVAGYYLGKESS